MALDWLLAAGISGVISYILVLLDLSIFTFPSTWMLIGAFLLLGWYAYAAYEANKTEVYEKLIRYFISQAKNKGEDK